MKTAFTHDTKVRVRYGETDQMGYCYYGNYAMYFEVGRVEALRHLGMSYRNLEEDGVMLPVSEYNVKYKAPALYDDELTIKTTINEVKGARIIFSYKITRDNITLAEASTTLVFVDKNTMKPTQPPQNFIDLIKTHEI